jgi:hypothetical protein
METINWLRQTADKPLFPDVLWSRPENKRHAGKLLIVGGHAQSFSAVSAAFIAASKAGAGTVRILLPDSLQKTLGRTAEAEFAASTPIGSFSQKALDHLLDLSDWSDAVMLAGDFGKNSETAILLEKFIDKYSGLLCLAGDSIDYFINRAGSILDRSDTLVIAEICQLQKLAQPRAAIKQQADLAQLVNMLSIFTDETIAELVTFHDGQVIAAVKGKVSTTKFNKGINREELAAYAVTWLIQQPAMPFESITTAVYDYCKNF